MHTQIEFLTFKITKVMKNLGNNIWPLIKWLVHSLQPDCGNGKNHVSATFSDRQTTTATGFCWLTLLVHSDGHSNGRIHNYLFTALVSNFLCISEYVGVYNPVSLSLPWYSLKQFPEHKEPDLMEARCLLFSKCIIGLMHVFGEMLAFTMEPQITISEHYHWPNCITGT